MGRGSMGLSPYIAAFRDPDRVARSLELLAAESEGLRATFMEVCGTHTVAIFRHGLRPLLPAGIRLISGPGCPVCVTPNSTIDRAVAMADLPRTTVATFGDMMRVPGSRSSLEEKRSLGADVRVVYSPLEAVEIASATPGRTVIFVAVGFETTAPAVAAAVLEASRRGLTNFFLLVAHKTMPQAMRALVTGDKIGLDGFICPGHVSTIIGAGPYRFLAEEFSKACVIAGFEPLDIVEAIRLLVRQVREKKPDVAIQYRRVVRPEGNPRALEIMYRVFEPCDSEWRGLGWIPSSGLRLREEFRAFDAEAQLAVEVEPPRENPGCRCGDVLRGLVNPEDCPLFGTTCTPDTPVGPCMVSTEGTCAAVYRYGERR
ncbi:MAG: hydrogenase formation protein HypD [candidate division KSB1 bacterium]|nr:hydrogenase formation protein HypD [candidate division KSB1 bacterium]